MKSRDGVTIVTRDEIKTCVTCAHAFNADDYLMCDKPEWVTVTPDLVMDGEWKQREHCGAQRRPEGKCGPAAVGFVPRRPDQWPADYNAEDIAFARKTLRREQQPRPSLLDRLIHFCL